MNSVTHALSFYALAVFVYILLVSLMIHVLGDTGRVSRFLQGLRSLLWVLLAGLVLIYLVYLPFWLITHA